MHGLLSIVLTAVVAVQPTAHPANDLAQALQPVRDAGAPAALVLVRENHLVRTAAVGVADAATGRPANAGDHFRAGSVTKTFVATVVLQLVADRPPQFPAGTDGHYSSTGYLLLGMIVEKVTGRSLATEIRRRITQPLGLRGTSLAEDTVTLPAPAMHGYAPGPGADPVDITQWNPSAAWAAGALVSTLSDLARFYRALLGGALLPRPQLRQMLTTTDVDGLAYGLGIFKIPTPCGEALGHNGVVFGYVTDVFTSLDGSRQVVLAENYYDEGAWRAQESLIGGLLCSN
ncbi:MAG: beta-lactamase family protein [Hamadaea sp.]|nr:beta-lactamase family protein [Hamadaea sp.]